MREKLAGSIALVAAVFASSCCWLPLLLIAIGTGSSLTVTSALEPYRIPFAILAFGALGTAWYLTYRKPQQKEEACCTPQTGEPKESIECPCCHKPGKRVGTRTVQALVSDPKRVRDGQYFLCLAPECALVYYGPSNFMREDLNTRVGFKESQAPHLVCYCFRHSAESIEDELRGTGNTTVPEKIKSKIQAGECACDVKNPQGTCCLGKVNRTIVEARKRLADQPSAPVGAPSVQCTLAPSIEENHDSCCGLTSPGSTSKIKSFNKAMLWVITPIVILLALFPQQMLGLFTRITSTQETRAVAPDEEKITLDVQGMT